MKFLGSVLLAALLLPQPAHAFGRSKRIKAIQSYCDDVQTEFTGSPPAVFSGPDPWTELDEVPSTMEDPALALVYSEGFAAPRWVFLRIAGEDKDRWSEDINYYFRADGSLVMRERHLQLVSANISLAQKTYYEHGKVLKNYTRHRALGPGKQKIAAFLDEPAPDYMTVDDLPFSMEDESGTELVSQR